MDWFLRDIRQERVNAEKQFGMHAWIQNLS